MVFSPFQGRSVDFPPVWKTFAKYSLSLSHGRDETSQRSRKRGTPATRFASTLVIAAAIVCAVRLARDDISRPSPRLFAAVADSVSLAATILRKVVGR